MSILYFQDVAWNLVFHMMMIVYLELVVLSVNALISYIRAQRVKDTREETEALYL